MNLRRFLLVPLMLAVAACANQPADKYPFPPQFVSPAEVPPTVLAPAPAKDSALTKREIKQIIARQAKLSAEQKAKVAKEDAITPSMMVTPVLGENYSEATHPALFTLLRHASSDAWRIGDQAQAHWGRMRPWVTDSRVQILVSTIKKPGYPSGHTTTNHVWAHVLSELFPNERQALFARAYAIGQHRVDAGVHFPSDVEAGKKLAAVIYGKMRMNAQYQRELAAARDELSGIHLPNAAANDNWPHDEDCVATTQGVSMRMCR